MNNPGIDAEIWERLRQKRADLNAQGHRLEIEYRRVVHPGENGCVLLIDVLQHIDGEPVTETVQKKAGEADSLLGITGLSMEGLVEIYGETMKELHPECRPRELDLVVTMTPTSPTSGEVSGLLIRVDEPVQTPVRVRYRHYYVLNALRERMIETLGEGWKIVRASYGPRGGWSSISTIKADPQPGAFWGMDVLPLSGRCSCDRGKV